MPTFLLTAWPLLKRALPYLAGAAILICVYLYVYQRGAHSRDAEVARITLQAVNSHNAFLLQRANQRQTVSNFRRATVDAQAADAEHARKSEQAQVAVNEGSDHDYQDQLATLRARYSRLRASSGATGRGADSGGGIAPVSAPGASAGGPDGTAKGDRLLDVAQAADENTLKLIQLQDAVRKRDDAFNAAEAEGGSAIPR